MVSHRRIIALLNTSSRFRKVLSRLSNPKHFGHLWIGKFSYKIWKILICRKFSYGSPLDHRIEVTKFLWNLCPSIHGNLNMNSNLINFFTLSSPMHLCSLSLYSFVANLVKFMCLILVHRPKTHLIDSCASIPIGIRHRHIS